VPNRATLSVTLILLLNAVVAAGQASATRAIAGVWSGRIHAESQDLRIILHIRQTADGALSATFDSPDQGERDLPVDDFTFRELSLRFELKSTGRAYEGRFDAAKSEIVGQWKQGGEAQPLTLKRLETTPDWDLDGSFLFQTHCASCHQPFSAARAPWPEVLRRMPRQAILTALEAGQMRAQGATLTGRQRAVVAGYLGEAEAAESKASISLCRGGPSPLADSPSWNGWGADISNSRFQSQAAAGLSRDQVPKLKLRWAFGFPGAASAYGQPTIFGGRLFLGSADGTVYSLDARTGCTYWTYKASAPVRTAVSIGPVAAGTGVRAAYFGDMQANVYAVDASTGVLRWKTQTDSHTVAMMTGAPVLYAGRLYVPVSSGEEAAAPNPKYECCTFRGSVVALDAETGKQLWKTFTIPEAPKPTRRNAAGTQLWGPSGAAVWTTPALDPERKAIYVGTGDNYSDPATPTSDAVLALDVDSGRVLWSQQLTPDDRWNIACMSAEKANCPENPGGDFDIGTPPILRQLSGGRSLLLVGQKSGIVHALDPDHGGKIVWQARLGRGGLLGGIEFGGAADEQAAYWPLSDYDFANQEAGGGLYALGIENGRKLWYSAAPKPACLGQPGCSAAQMAPPAVVPGVVFSGSLDGHLRAYNASDGTVIWDFNTLRDFPTVNGVKAHGGSLSFSGPTLASGMLFVNSGYSVSAGMPGNALLAFSVDGK
jgi:polyvinyl alcohol dehydrogenase (cytochrome)